MLMFVRLPDGLDEAMIAAHRTLARATLAIAERELSISPVEAEPLEWWPSPPRSNGFLSSV